MSKFTFLSLLFCTSICLAQSPAEFNYAAQAVDRDLTVISGWISKEASRALTLSSTIGANHVLMPRDRNQVYLGVSGGVSIVPLDVEGFRNLETEVINTRTMDIPERAFVPNLSLLLSAELPFNFHATFRGFALNNFSTTTSDGTYIEISNNQIGGILKYRLFEEEGLPFLHLGAGFDYITGSSATRRTDTSEATVTYAGGAYHQRDIIHSSSDINWDLFSTSMFLSGGYHIGNFTPSLGTSIHWFNGNTHTVLAAEDQMTLTAAGLPISETQTFSVGGENNGGPEPMEIKIQAGMEGYLGPVSLGLYGEYGVFSEMLAVSTVFRFGF